MRKSAHELMLPQDCYDLLIKARDKIETLIHIENPEFSGEGEVFNMRTFHETVYTKMDADEPRPCGTAACIGGWMSQIKYGNAGSVIAEECISLKPLFYPLNDQDIGTTWWHKITSKDAVLTIDHYLETGNIYWWPVYCRIHEQEELEARRAVELAEIAARHEQSTQQGVPIPNSMIEHSFVMIEQSAARTK